MRRALAEDPFAAPTTIPISSKGAVKDGLFQELEQIQSRLEPGADFEWSVTLSGREPNNLFWNASGRSFVDLSGVSGFDSEDDGRVLVLWDYDRDGLTDIAVVNANTPRLELYRNALADSRDGARRDDFVSVRLVGGAGSSRDACGARVELIASSGKMTKELQCGEGFAAQNSKTLHFGIGSAGPDPEGPLELTVYWPSGKVQRVDDVERASLVTVLEAEIF